MISFALQADADVVVEYVAAPAPDIEELIQAVPSTSTPDGTPAAAEADAMEDDEGGYGGLGLGATAGLGSTGGLGAGGGGLGLGFRKAGEPSTSAPVDPEVSSRRTVAVETCRDCVTKVIGSWVAASCKFCVCMCLLAGLALHGS